MVNRISAQIIADSINKQGDRITTYVLTFPRIVLAEFNTHRMISKNSASSRAIPFATMVQKVIDEPFIPIAWQEDHKGMQGNVYLEGATAKAAEKLWLDGRNAAIKYAKALNTGLLEFGDYNSGSYRSEDYGIKVTKQLANRMLEPYMYHTVICTGSEWENFFALRAHPAAEIHIADLAQKMLDAYNDSTPKLLEAGQWHIPFGDTFDENRLVDLYYKVTGAEDTDWVNFKQLELLKVKIATARCARVSYLNFEGKDDYEADIRLHDTLVTSGHYSPTEHCAMAADSVFHGNFKGWKQYRKFLSDENRTDDRVIKK